MLGMIFFLTLAFVLIGAAIGVIASRNPVFSALFLVLAFFTSAVLWMLLEAEFLAVVLVLVYLFVVMMLDVNVDQLREGFTKYAPVGAVVTVLMAAELATVFWFRNTGLPVLESPPPSPGDFSNTKELGAVLYTDYVYAFELAAFVLLLAIIAAIVLTMRRRPGLKVQDVAAQVSTRREDRVRIVQMEPETD